MREQPSVNLPDPAEKPGADVVLWDGKCNFCKSMVTRLHAFDRSGRLAYLSLHDARVAAWYPELSYEQLMAQMWVATSSGERHAGAAAVRYLSRKLPGLWWLAAPMHVPGSMPLWRWLYRQVARRRYRVLAAGGDCDPDGTCHLHHRPPH